MLLIHQIPPRPAYLRVKIGRHLQRIGAVAIKNSVYALPCSDETQEDFQWVLREVVKGGGDASIVEARFIDGLSDEQVVALFQNAREADYREMAEQAREVAASKPFSRHAMASGTCLPSPAWSCAIRLRASALLGASKMPHTSRASRARRR